MRGRFKLFARAADAATSQKCAATLPDDAKSVVYNGAALLGRDACAVTFVSSKVAGGDVAEISIDGFRLGPRVRAGLHALKGGLVWDLSTSGSGSRRGPKPNFPSAFSAARG